MIDNEFCEIEKKTIGKKTLSIKMIITCEQNTIHS